MAKTQRRIFLDLTYLVPVLTGVGHVAVYRPQWCAEYVMWFQRMSRGYSVPRFDDLQGTKERVLWQLLLYDKVLMPMTTFLLSTVANGLPRPLSPDLDKLVTMDFVEMVEKPPTDLAEVRVSSDLVRGF